MLDSDHRRTTRAPIAAAIAMALSRWRVP